MATDTNVTTATPMSLEAQVAAVTAKVDMIVGEMRDRDNRRAAENAEIRSSINSMNQHVRNLSITAMISLFSILAPIASLVLAALPTLSLK